METVRSWTERDLRRLDEIIVEGERRFKERQPRSGALIGEAREVLAGGATSSWQIARPQMIWVSHGEGSRIYDADGGEYVDLHGGYGVGAVGHGHPRIVEALTRRVPLGTHFAQPTEDAIAVADELARRFGLPLWRFSNSGTEATMDAVHLMRAITGRDLIVKVEGCYHGHHDSVMVSVSNGKDEIGPAERPYSAPSGTGIPRAITDLTLIVPYNHLDALERLFEEHRGQIAGMILEPIMMNAGVIPPEEGYLEGVREIVHDHGTLLAFDEVKCGVTTAYGGASGYLGVSPDIVCLAKAIGGGVPCGAIGGTEEVMGRIADGTYDQVGTFNGNPLTMAASRATLTQILIPEAYEHFDRLGKIMSDGVHDVVEEYDLAAYPLAFGAKGSVTFSGRKVRNYRDFLELDDRFSQAHWLFQHNGGVFLPPWGKAEQWTLSVQHSEDDSRRFVDNFGAFARALRR
ncbi:MAG TPA: aspartate aminotransferase family protein [Rubrobacter sp.]|nr:aspartate aminotransferase family protein [Rubrobacter sp.]